MARLHNRSRPLLSYEIHTLGFGPNTDAGAVIASGGVGCLPSSPSSGSDAVMIAGGAGGSAGSARGAFSAGTSCSGSGACSALTRASKEHCCFAEAPGMLV